MSDSSNKKKSLLEKLRERGPSKKEQEVAEEALASKKKYEEAEGVSVPDEDGIEEGDWTDYAASPMAVAKLGVAKAGKGTLKYLAAKKAREKAEGNQAKPTYTANYNRQPKKTETEATTGMTIVEPVKKYVGDKKNLVRLKK